MSRNKFNNTAENSIVLRQKRSNSSLSGRVAVTRASKTEWVRQGIPEARPKPFCQAIQTKLLVRSG